MPGFDEQREFLSAEQALPLLRARLESLGIRSPLEPSFTLTEQGSWCLVLKAELDLPRKIYLGMLLPKLLFPAGTEAATLWIKLAGWQAGWPHGRTVYGLDSSLECASDPFDLQYRSRLSLSEIEPNGRYGCRSFAFEFDELLSELQGPPKGIATDPFGYGLRMLR